MFDADDTEAEEGYEREGDNNEDDGDEEDDGEYAEAHENHAFATPAGSQAGDYDEHAIGEPPCWRVYRVLAFSLSFGRLHKH
jgi:hypothetical protein